MAQIPNFTGQIEIDCESFLSIKPVKHSFLEDLILQGFTRIGIVTQRHQGLYEMHIN